jgi:hypothetical protein
MGPQISQELADAIEQSGQPVQLAIAKIFEEGFASGTATVDQLATEMGDLFSGFSRGEFTKPQLITALEQSIPMLIERFGQLGPAGEAQINRIIEAAREMGVEFEGLGELISTSMGPSLQDVASTFDLSVQKAKKLGEILGVKLPTQTQILAKQLGLTPKKLKEIGTALDKEFGIGLDQIQVGDLAEGLGVKGVKATKDLKGSQVGANSELEKGVRLSGQLADNLGRAARNSDGISIPTGPAFSGEVISAARGFDSGVLSRPTFFPIVAHPREEVLVRDAGTNGTGGGISITIAPQVTISDPMASADDIKRRRDQT